jgi:hypothetical protein
MSNSRLNPIRFHSHILNLNLKIINNCYSKQMKTTVIDETIAVSSFELPWKLTLIALSLVYH